MANSRAEPAVDRDSEDAPLLVNDASTHHNENGSLDGEASGKTGNGKRMTGWLRGTGRKLWKNRMVVAIVLLLLGGFIALCVYFGGTSTSHDELLS